MSRLSRAAPFWIVLLLIVLCWTLIWIGINYVFSAIDAMHDLTRGVSQ